jgi:hypothetical protein
MLDYLFPRDNDPRRAVTVVDERTYRKAVKTVGVLLATGDVRDLVRAQFALTAITIWLRDDARTCRPSKLAHRTEMLAEWGRLLGKVNETLGLASPAGGIR